MAPLGGEVPTPIFCPRCRNQMPSLVKRKYKIKAHAIAGILCLIGCWPCCLIPYCMDSCQESNHYCPICDAFLGNFSK